MFCIVGVCVYHVQGDLVCCPLRADVEMAVVKIKNVKAEKMF